MLNIFPPFLNELGNRIQNYGYLLAHPSYASVRAGKGAADLYRFLDKKWFPKEKIQLVLDVGANEGQFIRTSLALMPRVPIYAFEPNPSAIKILKTYDWGAEKVTLFPIALGSQQETLTLNVSKFSPASSLLRNSNQLSSEFPETALETTVNVNVVVPLCKGCKKIE
jgi:FkbM family methyltransferase